MARLGSIKPPKLPQKSSGLTVRERAQKAQAETKPRRIRRAAHKLSWLPRFAKKLFNNKAGRLITRLFRKIGWLVPLYFKKSWVELKMVTWPGRRETWRLVGAVFIFNIIFGVLVAAFDKMLDIVFRGVVFK